MSSIFKVASKFEKKIAAVSLTNAIVVPVGKLLKSTGEIKQQTIKDFEKFLQEADKALREQMQKRSLEDPSIKDPTYGLLRSPATGYISSDLDNSLIQQLKKLVIDSFGYCRQYYSYALPKNPAENLELITGVVNAHQAALNKLNELSSESWTDQFSNVKAWSKFFTDKLSKGLLAAQSIQKTIESAQQGIGSQQLNALVAKATETAKDMQMQVDPVLDQVVSSLVSQLRVLNSKARTSKLSAQDVAEAQKRLAAILAEQASKKPSGNKVQSGQYSIINDSLNTLSQMV